VTIRRFARILRHRITSIWQPARLDREVARELTFHLDALEREGVEAGLSPAEARQAARRALGNPAVLQEECRDQRGVRWWHDAVQDLTYGARVLRRQPAFAAAAIASLALGIGANAAMLGAIDAVFVRRLPFPDADRLVAIQTSRLDHPDQIGGVSLGEYLDWSERQRSFQSIGLSMPWPADFGIDASGAPPERLVGQVFTPETFDTLGVQAAIGRTFTKDEGELGDAARVIVLSDGLWRRRFGADPGIVGRRIRIDQVERMVIGVMPPAFQYRDARADFWLPLIVNRQPGQNPSRLFGIVARLKPGVSLADARAEFRTLDAQLTVERPDLHQGWMSQLMLLRDAMYGWTLKPLLTLQAAVTVLLVIACVNLAALLLVRGTARAAEIRLRLALGASQGRVVRQLLAEGALLSLCGGLAGTFFGFLGLRGIAVAMTPPLGAPRVPELGLDLHVLGVTMALAAGSAVAFGLAPALSTARVAARSRSSASLTAVRPARSTGALVAAEVALAAILLVGAGLLARSFVQLTSRDLGFDPAGLVTFDYRAPGPAARQIGEYEGYQYFEVSPAPARMLQRILDRLRELPEVEAAAGIAHPLLDSPTTAIVPVASPDRVDVAHEVVTPGFFTTIGAVRFRGRDLADTDRVTTPWVAVVNESAARLLWPAGDALGQRLTLDIVPEEQPREVIGVVRDIPLQRAQVGARPVVYTSFLQQPSRYRAPWSSMLSQMNFVVRPKGAPLDALPALRGAVADVEASRPIGTVTVVSELTPFLRERRSYALTMGLFATVATLLAAMGVYGVVARVVTERTREIGIRRALGADSTDVIDLLGRRMSRLVAVGLAVGLGAALGLTRLIASQLWGVASSDPVTYAGAAALLIASAAAACLTPARRALSVDPSRALKEDQAS
jgi:putative ABC transport system permease protein